MKIKGTSANKNTLAVIFLGIFLYAPLIFSMEKKSFLEKNQLDSFYDPKVDYSKFSGRVTDRDKSANVIKISSENNNIKFFRSGDFVQFTTSRNPASDRCEGYIRDVEKNYFVIYVKDLRPCWSKGDYLRRGTSLIFHAKILAQRVHNASVFRIVLLKRREDFIRQLTEMNNFLWSFEQERLILAAEYDKKILEIERGKQLALRKLLVRKKDRINLQKELITRLDQLDMDLGHYRIEKEELFVDRWHLDQDLGLPVANRPQKLKPRSRNTNN